MSIKFVGYPEISCCMKQFVNIVHFPLILNNIALALKIVDTTMKENIKRGMIMQIQIIMEEGLEKQFNIVIKSKYREKIYLERKITFKFGEVRENLTSENIAEGLLRELNKLNNSNPLENIDIRIYPLKETASKILFLSEMECLKNEQLNFKVAGLARSKFRAFLVPLNVANCSDSIMEVEGEVKYSGELLSVLFSGLSRGDMYEMVIIYQNLLLASRILYIYNSTDQLPSYLADSLMTTVDQIFGQMNSILITINHYVHHNPINIHASHYLPIIRYRYKIYLHYLDRREVC